MRNKDPRCNYTFKTLQAIYIAMLSRQVDRGLLAMDTAKEMAVNFRDFCVLLEQHKELVAELKTEGLKVIETVDGAEQ